MTIPSSVAYTTKQLKEYIKNNEDGIRKIVYENKDKILDNVIKQLSDSYKYVLYESDEQWIINLSNMEELTMGINDIIVCIGNSFYN